MRKLLIAVIIILVIPFNSSAQIGSNITTRFFVAFGFETLTVSTVAVGFTAATIQPSGAAYRAERAEYSLEGCQIRYRIGSTNPTATVGTLLLTGNGSIYGWDNITAIKFIRDTSCSSNGTLSVHYYR